MRKILIMGIMSAGLLSIGGGVAGAWSRGIPAPGPIGGGGGVIGVSCASCLANHKCTSSTSGTGDYCGKNLWGGCEVRGACI